MDPILQLLTDPAYLAGVGTVIFINLVGLIVFAVFVAEPDAAIKPKPETEPLPEWLHNSTQLSRAAAARQAKADAHRWPKRNAWDEENHCSRGPR